MLGGLNVFDFFFMFAHSGHKGFMINLFGLKKKGLKLNAAERIW